MSSKPTQHYTQIQVQKKAPFLTASFFVATILFFGYLAYVAYQRHLQDNAPLSFASLHESYNKGGIEGLMEQKKKLKINVKKNLESTSTKQKQAAMNLAVYLFPDLLPKSNLERNIGKQQWERHQVQIEKAPHTLESRQHFEEMRANIWNYENPSRTQPDLSSSAKQVIRIYDALSSR